MDKTLLYLTLAIGVVILIVSFIVALNRGKNITGYNFVVQDTKTLLLMTALSFALGFALVCSRLFYDPTIGGEGNSGLYFVCIMAIIVYLIGGYTILYCFCNKVYVYEDKMIVLKPFSGPFEQSWEDIEKVEQPGMQRAARFTCKDVTFTVSGYNKQYKEFMTWVRLRLKGRTGRKLLVNVERNLSK